MHLFRRPPRLRQRTPAVRAPGDKTRLLPVAQACDIGGVDVVTNGISDRTTFV